ncbi:biotin-dependent carboxyltransferase family protein [Flexivirga sp. ID2601S]|uniref:Biotin-dependent carboxyltransferase family protein n=1 Tax=Flexivirga aerilata TaxID=1656889 RepID=A0A849ADV5_9MICO|nr:biotin-dependent carboxyltransferase family protein [Flexivirga aerilata]
MAELEVVATGPQCLVQDLGRPGLAGQGVTASGAIDRVSLGQGNRLVGNEVGAAGLEVLLGGLVVRAPQDLLIAVTGAGCPVTVDGRPVAFGAPVTVRVGSELRLGQAVHGLRSYLTVRGGLEAPGRFGGSLSTDTSSGLGAKPVHAGDRIPIGQAIVAEPRVNLTIPAVSTGGEIVVEVTRGPRADRLTPASRAALTEVAWTVTSDSDRIGVRLSGFRLQLADDSALPSEPIVRGAIQVPPSGEVIVFLADHPTTGGYPVVAVVDDTDVDRLAQAPPGIRVRLQGRPGPSWPTTG